MRGRHVDVARTHCLELGDRAHEGSAGIYHVVVDDAGLAHDVSDYAHDLGCIVPGATLVGDGDLTAQVVR